MHFENTGIVRTHETLDGTPLHYRCWPACGGVADRACIYLHGATTHSEWISRIAANLSGQGITVYGLDRRGSGLNRAEPFKVNRFKSDIAHFVEQRALEYDEVHLLGLCHGAITLLYCVVKDSLRVTSISIVNPLFKSQRLTAVNLFRSACSIVTNKPFAMQLEPAEFTYNPNYQRYIEQDPLRLPAVHPHFWPDALLMSKRLFGNSACLSKVPLHMFLGESNPFISLEKAYAFQKQFLSCAKVQVYPGGMHALFFDEPEQFSADCIRWMQAGWKRAPHQGLGP